MSLMESVFVDPPVDALAQHPQAPVYIALVVMLASLAFGVVYTRRTGSPLFFWCALAGVLFYPFVVEPIGDYFVAVWYPENLAIAAEPFGRPIPWLAVLFYAGGIPLVSVLSYEIARRGLPAIRLLQLVAVVAVLEVPIEMIGGKFDWMIYYGNHAVVLGVPIYCLVQNAGMFAIVAWVLARVVPQAQGWRWALVPVAVGLALPVFAAVTTWPAYLAIHLEAGPTVGWAAGILSTLLNAAAVLAAIYSPTLRQYRREAVASPAQLEVEVA